MSLFLASLKAMQSNEERQIVLENLVNLSKIFKKIAKESDVLNEYQVVSNLICAFVDYMKLVAPELKFENSTLSVNKLFYFLVLFWYFHQLA